MTWQYCTNASCSSPQSASEPGDDAQYTMQQEVQRAIHLATVKTIGEAGTIAPRSSPTSETQNLHQEALRRWGENDAVLEEHLVRKQCLEWEAYSS